MANFTPNQNDYNNMTPFKTWLKYQINTWGLNSFPFVESDFDDLTNYAMMMKLMKHFNVLIENQNMVEKDMTNLYNAFTELQTYLFDEFADYKNELNTSFDEYKNQVNGEIEQFETNITDDFNELHDFVDNYFDNNFPQMISDKLDEMAQDGTLENLLNDVAHLTKSYNTYTDMIADSATFTDGLRLKTLGYYSINDGGGANYFVNNQIISSNYQIDLQNGLYLNLILNNNVNLKQFGAKGDDVNDDTTSIQNAIDYSYDYNIKEVFVPFGTYKITKPIFLYTNMKIYGDNSNSSIIHKSTSTKSDVQGYDVDAIIILTNRELNSSNQSSQQEIDNIQLIGNVSEYVANKVDKQYAIYSKVYSPKIKITNFLINSVDYGIYTPSMYTGLIQNCVWLQAFYGAIASYTESQGVSISNINTGGSHEFGIKLSGGSYSTLSNILVEWNYDNVCYDLAFWRGNLINCGAELGSGFLNAIKLVNAHVTLYGGYFNTDRTNQDLVMFNLDNSSLKIENTSFGYMSDITNYAGAFANVFNRSSLIVGEGCATPSTFNKGILRGGDNNTFIINDTKLSLLTSTEVSSIAGPSNRYEGQVIDELNQKILNKKINSNSIYNGFISTPTNNGSNIEYYTSFNKGDIGIFTNPRVNGSAMWLCNKNNNSSEEPESVGTITEVGTDYIKMTDVSIENYNTNGYRFFPYCSVAGVTSGTTKIVSWVSFLNNELHFTNSTDVSNFQVGEKVKIVSTVFVRNGDYLYIPIINAGLSSQRPSQNLIDGMMFFDKTLGKPVWYNNGHWVDSSGTQV